MTERAIPMSAEVRDAEVMDPAALAFVDELASTSTQPREMVISVLVVEDDEFQRANLDVMFESANKTNKAVHFIVTIVDSASAALQLLQQTKPRVDLVLLDVYLAPGERNGLEMLPDVREAVGPRCAIVMLSAHQEFELVHECMAVGADAYLMKPIRHDEVKHLWQYCFRRNKTSDAGSASTTPSHTPRGGSAASIGHGRRAADHRYHTTAASPRGMPLGACDPGPRALGVCRLVAGPRPDATHSQRGAPSPLPSSRGSGSAGPGGRTGTPGSDGRVSSPRAAAMSPTGAGGQHVHSRCRIPGHSANILKPMHPTTRQPAGEDVLEPGCEHQ